MRSSLALALLSTILFTAETRGDDPPPRGADTAALEKRVAELERRLAEMQREVTELRRELRSQAAALTPAEAVKSFERDPKKPVRVEFGVESAGWPFAPIPVGEDPMPPVVADWDGRLPNGGKFSLLITAKAIRGLKDVGIELPPAMPGGFADLNRLDVLCKGLKGKGVRATGLVKPSRPGERHTDYYLVVDDPASFRVK